MNRHRTLLGSSIVLRLFYCTVDATAGVRRPGRLSGTACPSR